MGVANGFRQSMGGESEWAEQRKLSKFIVDWENGTRAACNNCANRAGNAINFAQVYLRNGKSKN